LQGLLLPPTSDSFVYSIRWQSSPLSHPSSRKEIICWPKWWFNVHHLHSEDSLVQTFRTKAWAWREITLRWVKYDAEYITWNGWGFWQDSSFICEEKKF
jgi:hypothetical protein